jgi:hypothetical protein
MPWPPLATALIGQREKSAEAVKIETERCHEKPMNYFFLDHLNFHPTLPPSTRQPLPSDPVKVTNESSKETRNKQAMETPVNRHKLKPGLRAEAFNFDYCNF